MSVHVERLPDVTEVKMIEVIEKGKVRIELEVTQDEARYIVACLGIQNSYAHGDQYCGISRKIYNTLCHVIGYDFTLAESLKKDLAERYNRTH